MSPLKTWSRRRGVAHHMFTCLSQTLSSLTSLCLSSFPPQKSAGSGGTASLCKFRQKQIAISVTIPRVALWLQSLNTGPRVWHKMIYQDNSFFSKPARKHYYHLLAFVGHDQKYAVIVLCQGSVCSAVCKVTWHLVKHCTGPSYWWLYWFSLEIRKK